ncbi:EamA/RhaT family transporter, type 4 [Campylobacter sp. RM5004]|uniref:EamA family transporter n=1 Tax=Campylobacter sp. RM5004 TaxID=1660078 RepID=UPI001EFAB290|nr:EamA family transporter [Campylobacter sp. RM5004]ULO00905.1 EamA/RhaT family transporter, type 4 [Campylobacter sp. RM5004]
MFYLWITTFIWAFSFPIIGYFISGKMDSYFAIFIRVFIAFLVFLPLLNRNIFNKLKLLLILIGSLEIGLMYLFYYNSFRFLSVSEVALFTIFTPFYVSLFYDLFSKKLRAFYLISISISVLGAFIIKQGEISSDFLKGFLLIQAANIVFGAAQSLYKIVCEKYEIKSHKEIFGYFFLGACIVSLIAFLILGDFSKIPSDLNSYLALIYLGLIASSIGYFCWNKGATLVNSGTLALMNNAIIPVAILVNLIFFKVDIDFYNFTLGSLLMIIAAVFHKFYAK